MKNKKSKIIEREVNIMNIEPSMPDDSEFEIEVSIGGKLYTGVVSLDNDDINE